MKALTDLEYHATSLAEAEEYAFARRMVGLLYEGWREPYVAACYFAYGLHPDKLIPALAARRAQAQWQLYKGAPPPWTPRSARSPKKVAPRARTVGVMGILVMMLVTPALAKTHPAVHSADQNAQDRVSEATTYLPALDGWTIYVIPGEDWLIMLPRNLARYSAHTCYSEVDSHTTYCRLEWARDASVRQIAHTLAHELGHFACNCADEGWAENYANRLAH